MYFSSITSLLLLYAENVKEQQRLADFTKSLFKEHNKQL